MVIWRGDDSFPQEFFPEAVAAGTHQDRFSLCGRSALFDHVFCFDVGNGASCFGCRFEALAAEDVFQFRRNGKYVVGGDRFVLTGS
ncbi:hypothetical protein CR163_010620 [Prosthecochloris sp. ZM_2]|nr:hypothetical protein CR163_010620 [Prosthecochloris sp. ZM_2]